MGEQRRPECITSKKCSCYPLPRPQPSAAQGNLTSCLNFDFAILNLFEPSAPWSDGPEVEHGAHFLILYNPKPSAWNQNRWRQNLTCGRCRLCPRRGTTARPWPPPDDPRRWRTRPRIGTATARRPAAAPPPRSSRTEPRRRASPHRRRGDRALRASCWRLGSTCWSPPPATAAALPARLEIQHSPPVSTLYAVSLGVLQREPGRALRRAL